MALQTDPTVFSPDDLADESLFDEEEPKTRPGATPRVVAPRPASSESAARPSKPPTSRQVREAKDPDAEAIEIATKMIEKVAVARSLARIFAALAREHVGVASMVARAYADQKMSEIVEKDGGNAVAHIERARKIALAAKEAAKHATSLAAARAAARAQEVIAQTTSVIDGLDPEEAHDDAC